MAYMPLERLLTSLKTITVNGKALTQRQLAADLGYKRETSVSEILRGKTKLTPKFAKAYCARYGISERWLMEGEGEMLAHNNPSDIPDKPPAPTGFHRNARPLGEPVDMHVSKSGNTFVELASGKYLMSVAVIGVKARAGFVGGGYGDPEFIESLPKRDVVVDALHKGDYLWFDIDGDSMDDGTIQNAVPSGSSVLTRNIKMDLWRSRFHYKQYKWFVIVHKTDGIFCKQITHHDIEKGIITCHSLNPNKHMYPDFDVSLDDCLQIRNVVKRELND